MEFAVLWYFWMAFSQISYISHVALKITWAVTSLLFYPDFRKDKTVPLCMFLLFLYNLTPYNSN